MKPGSAKSCKYKQIKKLWIAWALVRGAFFVAGCGSGVVEVPPKTPPAPPGVRVSVSPSTANIRAGDSYTFQASVSGTSNTSVTWAVNGTNGGSAATGTI